MHIFEADYVEVAVAADAEQTAQVGSLWPVLLLITIQLGLHRIIYELIDDHLVSQSFFEVNVFFILPLLAWSLSLLST